MRRWQAYSEASTSHDCEQNNVVSLLLCDLGLRPESRRHHATLDGVGETTLVRGGSGHGRFAPRRPTPSVLYVQPGTPTCLLSHAGCSQILVVQSSLELLGG